MFAETRLLRVQMGVQGTTMSIMPIWMKKMTRTANHRRARHNSARERTRGAGCRLDGETFKCSLLCLQRLEAIGNITVVNVG
jgi:hypothetical protein